MLDPSLLSLFRAALAASRNAYAPYSRFPVGAAVLTEGGVFTGVNAENRSFGLTLCAERAAVSAAIAAGCRVFRAAAVAAPASPAPTPPCGACRQVLSEFAPPDTPVVFGASEDALTQTTLGALYPCDSLHNLAGLTAPAPERSR